MPRPVGAQGRPGTQVIPAAWETHHRGVAEKTMTAVCTIRHPGGTRTYNDVTGLTSVTPNFPYFTGPCRVQALAVGDSRVAVAEQQVTSASYLISVPAVVSEVAVDDQVTVTSSTDPSLTAKTLRVTSVQRGSLRFERDLIALDDLG
jgi:hypothetical protein